MAEIPEKLEQTLDALSMVPDRSERIQLLIDIAGKFKEVPPQVATRPFPEENRVPACESEAFVWAERRQDGNLDFHFAVENPQGISAKAMAVILKDSLSGQPLDQVAAVNQDIVYKVFGNELSMGKSMGLMGMVGMISTLAKRAQGAG
ncbi:MAG TPA: SufE family protein [Thermoanaerobaculia bacterium]|nr:SufE family protein [Thermoanaerobaculia bacterium]